MAGLISGVVGEYLANTYNGRFQYDVSTFSVGTSSERLLNNDPERVFTLIVNLSVNNVVVSPLPDVSLTEGIFLSSSGGSVSMNLRNDLIVPSLTWNAIASAGSSEVYVLSVRRYAPITEQGVQNGQ